MDGPNLGTLRCWPTEVISSWVPSRGRRPGGNVRRRVDVPTLGSMIGDPGPTVRTTAPLGALAESDDDPDATATLSEMPTIDPDARGAENLTDAILPVHDDDDIPHTEDPDLAPMEDQETSKLGASSALVGLKRTLRSAATLPTRRGMTDRTTRTLLAALALGVGAASLAQPATAFGAPGTKSNRRATHAPHPRRPVRT